MKHLWFVIATVIVSLGRPAFAAEPANQWMKLDEGKTGSRLCSALVPAPDLKALLLVGPGGGAFVQAFDPAAGAWSDLASPSPVPKGNFFPYYQAAYDPGTRKLYCLSGGPVLYALSMTDKTWQALPAPELAGMSWHALACDPVAKQLVVLGADKEPDHLGWCQTMVYDLATGKWSRLEVSDEAVARENRDLVAGREAVIDWVGRLRLAWYRDPKGVGTDAELQALIARGKDLKQMPHLDSFAPAIDATLRLLGERKTLDALQSARALQRAIEERAEGQYPVPCSRRNAPLVFDPKHRVFVLFGGDHEDYLLNDTWILDLAAKRWRRATPDLAPSPRAGHALCYLPKSGKVALYEGYIQSSSSDYSASPYATLNPRQLWLFDAETQRWDLAGSWPLPLKADRATPAALGRFEGYAHDRFSPPALVADDADRLILAAHATGGSEERRDRPSETWTLALDPAQLDSANREKLGAPPNQRRYRTGFFQAAFCEVPDAAPDTGLDRLPANQWVRLPKPPRNPCEGCRQRDWGTCVWDSDREQILHWGGGHCVRAASVVAHYSPVSGRIVEGYDADEPYSANGGGGFDSSLLGRAWVSVHNYHHYAYDPRCKLLVSARGYLYDPERMDWLRQAPLATPFAFEWGHTYVATSAHGAVAWAQPKGRDTAGLWLFDRERGWEDLKPQGKLFLPYCDAHGMVYDAKRDRMILGGMGGGYQKLSSGAFLSFDFKTRALDTITPDHAEFAQTHNARELVYVDYADWMLIGEVFPPRSDEEPKGVKHYTRVYDCAKNAMFLLDAGEVPSGHSTGWMYDARRQLVYVFTYRGEAWALRVDTATARRIEKAP